MCGGSGGRITDYSRGGRRRMVEWRCWSWTPLVLELELDSIGAAWHFC